MKISIISILLLFIFFSDAAVAQYKSFKISPKGDTVNVIDIAGKKQGPWIVHVDPLRGEPGYEEEGYFVNDKKEGAWRRYTLSGDFIAMENFRDGDKDGKSQYFNAFGDLLREENWRAYNPNAPYDTIPVYGKDNSQIISYKIVKAQPYSVKDGDWTWYDPQTGRIARIVKYDRGQLLSQKNTEETVAEEPLKKIKPKEVVEFEKKNSGKKVKLRDGRTSN